MAGIVKAESEPAIAYLLKDVKSACILLYAPDLVQVQIEQGAGQNLVNDLMASQSDSLLRMEIGQIFEHVQEAGLNVEQAFAAGKMNLTGCTLPSRVLLGIGRSRFRVRQALESAIVDIDQPVVRLDRQAQITGEWLKRLSRPEEWTGIEC